MTKEDVTVNIHYTTKPIIFNIIIFENIEGPAKEFFIQYFSIVKFLIYNYCKLLVNAFLSKILRCPFNLLNLRVINTPTVNEFVCFWLAAEELS